MAFVRLNKRHVMLCYVMSYGRIASEMLSLLLWYWHLLRFIYFFIAAINLPSSECSASSADGRAAFDAMLLSPTFRCCIIVRLVTSVDANDFAVIHVRYVIRRRRAPRWLLARCDCIMTTTTTTTTLNIVVCRRCIDRDRLKRLQTRQRTLFTCT